MFSRTMFYLTFMMAGLLSLSSCWGGTAPLSNLSLTYSITANLSIDANSTDHLCHTIVSKNASVMHMQTHGSNAWVKEWYQPLSGGPHPQNRATQILYYVDQFASQYYSSRFAVMNQSNSIESYPQIGAAKDYVYIPSAGMSSRQLIMWNNLIYSYYKHLATDTNHGQINNIIDHSSGFLFENGIGAAYGTVFTHDHSQFITWTDNTHLTFYSLSGNTMTQTASYSGLVTSAYNVTEYISISEDDSLAVVETDGQHPITVFSLNNYGVVGQYNFTGTIHRASFINNSLILITTSSELYALQTDSGTITLVSTLQSVFTASEWDPFKDYLYLCKDNYLSVVSFAASNYTAPTQTTNTTITPNATNTTANTTSTTNTTTTTVTTEYNPLLDEEVVINLDMSQDEKQVTQALAGSLEYSKSVTDKVIKFAFSNPFTFFFMSFINFFTICSNYVLIQMPIPLQLFDYLFTFYQEINKNLFTLFWNPCLKIISKQKVVQKKLIYLGLTTDLVVGQTLNLLLAMTNIFCFQVMRCCLKRFQKNSSIRRILYQPQFQIFFGQCLALIMPLVTLWIFYIYGGVNSLSSKANTMVQYLLFFIMTFMPFYYLIKLVDVQKSPMIPQKSSKAVNSGLQQNLKMKSSQRYKELNPSKTNDRLNLHYASNLTSPVLRQKVQINRKTGRKKIHQNERRQALIIGQSKKSKKNPVVGQRMKIDSLGVRHIKQSVLRQSYRRISQALPSITAEMQEMWYIAFCNFIYPLLLVVPYVYISLVGLLIVSLLGLVISLRLQQYRLNKVILSCYPVLFHVCFIVFKLIKDRQILVYTQIICLSTLFVGSIHQLGFLIFSMLSSAFSTICHNNKVAVKAQSTKQSIYPRYITPLKKGMQVKATQRKQLGQQPKDQNHQSSFAKKNHKTARWERGRVKRVRQDSHDSLRVRKKQYSQSKKR